MAGTSVPASLATPSPAAAFVANTTSATRANASATDASAGATDDVLHAAASRMARAMRVLMGELPPPAPEPNAVSAADMGARADAGGATAAAVDAAAASEHRTSLEPPASSPHHSHVLAAGALPALPALPSSPSLPSSPPSPSTTADGPDIGVAGAALSSFFFLDAGLASVHLLNYARRHDSIKRENSLHGRCHKHTSGPADLIRALNDGVKRQIDREEYEHDFKTGQEMKHDD